MKWLATALTALCGLAALALRHRPDLLLALLVLWCALGLRWPHAGGGQRFWRPDLAQALLLLLVGLVICAPVLAPFDPAERLAEGDLLGLDRLGRDQFSRLLLGSRASVLVALGGSLLALLLGTAMAGLLALAPRVVQVPARLICQAWLALPAMLFFCLGIALVDQAGVGTLVLLLGLTLWLEPARMLEARVVELRGSDFVVVARMAGKSEHQIFLREILPNLRPIFIVNLLLTFHAALLLESALGFLGLGRALGSPSLGAMIEQSVREMDQAPATFLAAIALLIAWLAALRGVASGFGASGPLRLLRTAPGTGTDLPHSPGWAVRD